MDPNSLTQEVDEQKETINNPEEGTQGVAESSTANEEEYVDVPELNTLDDREKYFSDLEEEAEETSDDSGRLDQDERFQQLLQERDQAKAELDKIKAELDYLKQQIGGGQNVGFAPQQPAQPSTSPFGTTQPTTDQDINDDELINMMVEKPKDFINLIRQQTLESVLNQVNALTQQQRMQETIVKYAQENPDFVDMWKNGQIQAFMAQNPGHNAISAHMALTQQQRMQKAIEEAVKKKEEELIKQFKAKKKAAVLGAGPSTGEKLSKPGIPPELQDPKKFGGRTTVLAQRLERLRKQQGL